MHPSNQHPDPASNGLAASESVADGSLVCTCLPTCDDICRGDCGCEFCRNCFDAPMIEPAEQAGPQQPNYDDPYCPVLKRCEHCGRPASEGHKPECVSLGGDLDYAKRGKEKVKEQIKGLERELKKKRAELAG